MNGNFCWCVAVISVGIVLKLFLAGEGMTCAEAFFLFSPFRDEPLSLGNSLSKCV